MRKKLLDFILLLITLSSVIISGCATTSDGNVSIHLVNQAADYPVTIISATYVPAFDVEIGGIHFSSGLPGVSVFAPNTGTYGRTRGALLGAGRGILECSQALAAGPFAPFVFIPCAVLAAPTGAVAGALTSTPKSEIDAFLLSLQDGQGVPVQKTLEEKASVYLMAVSGQPLGRAAPHLIGPKSSTDHPQYQARTTDAHGSLLELSLLQIRYAGSGRLDDPMCLSMSARGRKIDAATGTVIDELTFTRIIECQMIQYWLADGGELFSTALENGYQILAEHLIDKLYLIYRSPPMTGEMAGTKRSIPEFVLAPIAPRAPDIYLDFRGIAKQDKHLQGWGGMHFVDIDSLTPTFIWEAFPRWFDMPMSDFADVSYDIRIFESRVHHSLFVAEPSTLLREVTGLIEPRYSTLSALQPCHRYFWTIRARFDLHGIRRVTEWAGAYVTVGGEVPPSYEYYYPFRTPSSSDGVGCWSK